jgi:hypothetical protein
MGQFFFCPFGHKPAMGNELKIPITKGKIQLQSESGKVEIEKIKEFPEEFLN